MLWDTGHNRAGGSNLPWIHKSCSLHCSAFNDIPGEVKSCAKLPTRSSPLQFASIQRPLQTFFACHFLLREDMQGREAASLGSASDRAYVVPRRWIDILLELAI